MVGDQPTRAGDGERRGEREEEQRRHKLHTFEILQIQFPKIYRLENYSLQKYIDGKNTVCENTVWKINDKVE